LKNKELVRNCEAETVKKIKNFRLKAKHKVPIKKRVYILVWRAAPGRGLK